MICVDPWDPAQLTGDGELEANAHINPVVTSFGDLKFAILFLRTQIFHTIFVNFDFDSLNIQRWKIHVQS